MTGRNVMSPDELEAALRRIGAERYHNLHPFHRRLHDGLCSRDEVRAWALNRYYYQSMIPIKDATVLSRMGIRRCGGHGASGSSTMTAARPATAGSRAG